MSPRLANNSAIIILLAIRLSAGAFICLYGLAKLMRLRLATERMWRPAWVGRSVMLAGVGCTSVAELAFGWMAALSPAPPVYTILAGALLCIGLSIYGTAAIRHTGCCGCNGGAKVTPGKVAAQRNIWLRNFILFGSGAAGATFGPSLYELTHSSTTFVPILPILPASIFLLLLIIRFLTPRRNSTNNFGPVEWSAVYQRMRYYA
jgi:hypothetical protein